MIACYRNLFRIGDFESQPLIERQRNRSCRPIESIIRLVLFVYASRTNCFLRFLQNRCENNILERSVCSCRENFDLERLQKGERRLLILGAELTQISTDDEVKLGAIFLSPQILFERIRENGGSWEKLILENNDEVIAIVPPSNPSENWNSLYQAILKMRWEKSQHKGTEIIITARNASLLPFLEKPICALLVSMNHPFIFDLDITSFFLGLGISVVSYNGRGICTSEGTPSEAGAYADADAAYQFAKSKGFNPENIWVRADCMNTWVSTYLLKKHGSSGTNFLHETPPLGLENIIEQENPLMRFFARRNLYGALHVPEEPRASHQIDNFDSLLKARQIPEQTLQGRIVCTAVTGDLTTPLEKIQTLVNALKVASLNVENVSLIQIDPKEEGALQPRGLANPHMMSIHHVPSLRDRFVQILFSFDIAHD